MKYSMLHIEDDPNLANLVKTAFEGFGFTGEMLTAGTVREALAILKERTQLQEPLNLILSDMRLPDGTGLDVISAVRSSPAWRLTPVVILSGENSSSVISDTYAMGANCFLPKIPESKTVLEMLHSLYECWLDTTILPEGPPAELHLKGILDPAIRIRARQADLYMSLSQAFAADPPQSEFWLNRALNEGNFANMAVFFQRTLGDTDMALDDSYRLVQLQSRTNAALDAAEQFLKDNPRPATEACLAKILDVLEVIDEGAITSLMRHILPRNPVAARAFQSAVVDHLREMAFFIGERAELPSLHERATALVVAANKLKATPT